MGKKMLILLSFAILLLSVNLVSADCLNLAGYTSWYPEDNHKIILYRGSRPIARLRIPYCNIQPSASIRLLKGYTCDSDDIIIDNEKCSIMTVDSLSF
jgi:hypothetical protein